MSAEQPTIESQLIAQVYDLEKSRHELDRAIGHAVRLAWPCGKRVKWMKTGRHAAFGHVMQHDGGRIFVENEATLAKVWITPYHISRATNVE